MNIFEQYLDKIKKIILDQAKNGELVLPERLDGITAEIPPAKFDSDISTNVAMFLSKLNNKPPLELAKLLTKPIKENDDLIEDVSVVKPGFINIKLGPHAVKKLPCKNLCPIFATIAGSCENCSLHKSLCASGLTSKSSLCGIFIVIDSS